MERPPPTFFGMYIPPINQSQEDHFKDAVLGEECVVETIWMEHVIEST